MRHGLIDINKNLNYNFKKVSIDQILQFKNELVTNKIKGNSRMHIRWFRDNFGILLNKS